VSELRIFSTGRFRSTIDMAAIASARRYRTTSSTRCQRPSRPAQTSFYAQLAPIANGWAALLRGDVATFPLEHEELLARCHAAGQLGRRRLILRYGEATGMRVHQDLYGEVYFPFQVLTVLSRRGEDFDGGEFVLSSSARGEERAHVVRRRRARRDLPDRSARTAQERLQPRRAAPG